MAAMRPRVGPVVVAEVVVSRVLAAEGRAGRRPSSALMKLCPTLVRTGVAAVLGDDLGDGLGADQVVQDRGAGLLLEHRRRRRCAVVVEPEMPLALLVDEEDAVGVAVEGEADVGADLDAPGRTRSRWFSGWIGSAGWLGNVPSSSPYMISRSNGSPSNTAGTTSPPMPLAVSATTLSGRSADTSTNERTWSAKAPSRSALAYAVPAWRPPAGRRAAVVA